MRRGSPRPRINGTSLREEALASGLVGAAEFDALVRPEAMLAPGD
jgi:fumarate hydratase class II